MNRQTERQRKIPIHPLIDPHLTKTYHLRYGPLFTLHTQNRHIRHALTVIQKMSNNLSDPLVSNPADNARSAIEILEHEFVLSGINSEKSKQTDNLLRVLKRSLQKAGYSDDKIKETLSGFDEKVTIGEYLCNFQHIPLVKALCFPNLETFKAYYRETALADKRSKQRLELQLTPRLLCLTIKNNDNAFHDGPRQRFFENLKGFVEKADKCKQPDAKILQKAGQNGVSTLSAIQRNCIFLANAALASETDENSKTLSLTEYSTREHYFKTFFLHKNLTKVNRIVGTSSKPIDLIRNTEDIPLRLNCYKCPSAASNTPPKEKNEKKRTNETASGSTGRGLTFVDKVKGNFNVNRLLPITSYDEAKAHMSTYHSVGHFD